MANHVLQDNIVYGNAFEQELEMLEEVFLGHIERGLSEN